MRLANGSPGTDAESARVHGTVNLPESLGLTSQARPGRLASAVSVGQCFGALVIVATGLRVGRRIAAVAARCQCGRTVVCRVEHVLAHRTTSCGCIRAAQLAAAAQRRATEAAGKAQATR